MLLNGDCLEELNKIPSSAVDLVFCDLPYGVTDCKWDTKIDLLKLWKSLRRVAKKDAVYFFTCTTKFGFELIASNKKMYRYDLVWEKSNITGFLLAGRQPLRKHEMIYVFARSGPDEDSKNEFVSLRNYFREFHKKCKNIGRKAFKAIVGHTNAHLFYYDAQQWALGRKETYMKLVEHFGITDYRTWEDLKKEVEIERPKRRYDIKKCHKVVGIQKTKAHISDLYSANITQHKKYEPPLPTSVLKFKRETGWHNTQKPVSLMKWILKYYTEEGDTILDPTMGSGSMGVACKELKRKFIGIEKDPEIFQTALTRLRGL